ncbi:uncharacterized protein DS421_13g398910 [Arachis hypogaea]|nr:uncharacterized protein DS421_13g398910 [Arachis hypogaea]
MKSNHFAIPTVTVACSPTGQNKANKEQREKQIMRLRGILSMSFRISNQIGRLPSRSGQQRKILPTKLERTVFLNEGIPSPREHPKEQTSLRGRVSPKRNGSKSDPSQLLSPALHFNLAGPLGTSNGHDVPDLAP